MESKLKQQTDYAKRIRSLVKDLNYELERADDLGVTIQLYGEGQEGEENACYGIAKLEILNITGTVVL